MTTAIQLILIKQIHKKTTWNALQSEYTKAYLLNYNRQNNQ